ncbi:hypothetical protein Pcinc_007710 [Petrolisthes cinctipes]|uniref:Uncharacterized protein n=1 Tax=Petrolisthes cinctipes TaxID=88211 RepID=A0AAE1KWN0_PETCI|nr:hypothetical protein Pcinc_007710 [Petrolisthes cinctipes]
MSAGGGRDDCREVPGAYYRTPRLSFTRCLYQSGSMSPSAGASSLTVCVYDNLTSGCVSTSRVLRHSGAAALSVGSLEPPPNQSDPLLTPPNQSHPLLTPPNQSDPLLTPPNQSHPLLAPTQAALYPLLYCNPSSSFPTNPTLSQAAPTQPAIAIPIPSLTNLSPL